MIEVAIPLCRLDHKPINDSEIYQKIKQKHGEGFASLFSYDYIVKHGSDEMKEAMHIITGGIPPKGRKIG